MANLGAWSWDIYDTAQAPDAFFTWPGSASISTVNPRTGTRDLLIIGAFGPQYAVADKQTLFFGTALNPNVFGGVFNGYLVLFNDAGTTQIKLGISGAGALVVLRGNDPFPTELGRTANGLVTAGIYQYIEIKVVISNTVGEVIVRLNGTTVLTLSNVDTQETGNAYVNIVQFMSLGGGGNWRHDDSYLNDETGSENNGFEGAITMNVLPPIADGSPVAWSPSAGANWECVDEIPPSTADFVFSDSVGDLDQYLYDATLIPVGQDVKLVRHSLYAALDSAGSHVVASNLDGIDGDAGTALTTSYRYVQTSYGTKNGLAWTAARVSTAQLGPKLVS